MLGDTIQSLNSYLSGPLHVASHWGCSDRETCVAPRCVWFQAGGQLASINFQCMPGTDTKVQTGPRAFTPIPERGRKHGPYPRDGQLSNPRSYGSFLKLNILIYQMGICVPSSWSCCEKHTNPANAHQTTWHLVEWC